MYLCLGLLLGGSLLPPDLRACWPQVIAVHGDGTVAGGSLPAVYSGGTPVDGAASVGREPPKPSRPPQLPSRRASRGPREGSRSACPRPAVYPPGWYGRSRRDKACALPPRARGVPHPAEGDREVGKSRGSRTVPPVPGGKGLTPTGMSQGGQGRTTLFRAGAPLKNPSPAIPEEGPPRSTGHRTLGRPPGPGMPR